MYHAHFSTDIHLLESKKNKEKQKQTYYQFQARKTPYRVRWLMQYVVAAHSSSRWETEQAVSIQGHFWKKQTSWGLGENIQRDQRHSDRYWLDIDLPQMIQQKLLTHLCMKSLASQQLLNSLGPSDAIWRWRSWSTLVQVMACCLTAPSHYLNQCWLIISKVLWHSSEDIIMRRFEDSNQ